MVPVHNVLGRLASRPGAAHAGSRGDDEWPVRTGEHAANGLDNATVLFAIGDEAGEIVIERGVDHRVGLRGTLGHAVRVFDRAAMRFGPGVLQQPRTGLRTGQPEYT